MGVVFRWTRLLRGACRQHGRLATNRHTTQQHPTTAPTPSTIRPLCALEKGVCCFVFDRPGVCFYFYVVSGCVLALCIVSMMHTCTADWGWRLCMWWVPALMHVLNRLLALLFLLGGKLFAVQLPTATEPPPRLRVLTFHAFPPPGPDLVLLLSAALKNRLRFHPAHAQAQATAVGAWRTCIPCVPRPPQRLAVKSTVAANDDGTISLAVWCVLTSTLFPFPFPFPRLFWLFSPGIDRCFLPLLLVVSMLMRRGCWRLVTRGLLDGAGWVGRGTAVAGAELGARRVPAADHGGLRHEVRHVSLTVSLVRLVVPSRFF